MAGHEDIEALLKQGLGGFGGLDGRVKVAASAIDCGYDDLFPEERVHVERAVEKRRREFATGRVLARRLLGELGLVPSPILPAEDRSPIWPFGVVGSISHTIGVCAAVLARSEDARGIGVDVEARKALKPELHEMVLRPSEQAWLRGLPEAERGLYAMLVFSAKECTYKCQYPLTRVVLEFEEVELEIDRAAGRFSARILHREAAERAGVARLEGFYGFTEAAVLSGMILPPPSCR
jgi:4'-phosphopantetheinyl transferase EntD